jgi:hypothetical protein
MLDDKKLFENDQKYWKSEIFEDKVTRSLIAMYENKTKIIKKILPACRVSSDLIKRVQNLGCYFPANDRIMMESFNENTSKASRIQSIDAINDGRPDNAIFCIDKTCDESGNNVEGYLFVNYMERIKVLPKPFKTDIQGKIYRIAFLDYTNNHVSGTCDYVVIDSKGNIYPVYRFATMYDQVTGRMSHFKDIPNGETTTCEDNVVTWASATIQFYQDRRYLWNVQANEGKAKATFAVYPEQIKSLFYARELPLTETGRKRPILHWVAAHRRRLEKGIDIDIEKYLRGITEFIYKDTKFIITMPLKNNK